MHAGIRPEALSTAGGTSEEHRSVVMSPCKSKLLASLRIGFLGWGLSKSPTGTGRKKSDFLVRARKYASLEAGPRPRRPPEPIPGTPTSQVLPRWAGAAAGRGRLGPLTALRVLVRPVPRLRAAAARRGLLLLPVLKLLLQQGQRRVVLGGPRAGQRPQQ